MNESEIQKTIFKHFQIRGAPKVFMFHPRNEGRDQRGCGAAINAAKGVIAGTPDLIAGKNGKFYALELKVPGGRLSEDQEQVLIRLRAAGAVASHSHGLDQALHILEAWGLLRGCAT